MDQDSCDRPDEATARSESPRQETLDERAFKAHKEVMLDILRSNTAYMDSVKRLYRGPVPDADISSNPPNLFFYGSLMDPDVVRVIAEISAAEPQLLKASIRGFKLKMWGVYPTLVPGFAEDTVQGVYWQAENMRQIDLIQRYETHRYKPATCVISVGEDARTIEDGQTFVWAGDPASKELKDGEFLLERYQLYFKPDIFKRKA